MTYLIVVEGYDGVGKSTLIKKLRENLICQGYDFTVVKAFLNLWVPEPVMADVVMGLLPDEIAAQLRLHRYLMQRQSTINPYIEGGVNVLSDRGPASAIWRLIQQGREDLVPLVQGTLQGISMHVVINCSAKTCFNRILKTRYPTRAETNFLPNNNARETENAFMQNHSNYYETVNRVLNGHPTVWIDGEKSENDVLSQCLDEILILLKNEDHKPDISYYDGLAAEVKLARDLRCENTAYYDIETLNNLVVRDGTELMRREWLQSVSENNIRDVKHLVIELARCPQAHVRETALRVLNKFGFVLHIEELLKCLNDSDKDVRKEASIMVVRLNTEEIKQIVEALSSKPGAALESLVETMQSQSQNASHQSLVMSLVKRFPYLCQAVARGCKRQKELDAELIAALLADDKARITFLTNLGENVLKLPEFPELKKVCQQEIEDEAWATIVALQATASVQNPNGLLRYGSLLYDADHQVAKATVETWLSCGLGAWIPNRFEQNPDFTIRRRLAMAKFPNRSGDHPKASPINRLFFSTRPGYHLGKKVPFQYIQKFSESLVQKGFTQILVLTTESKEIEYYGDSLVELYKNSIGQSIDVKRFSIPRFSVPVDENNAEDHQGIKQVIDWLSEGCVDGYKLVHCSGGRGRTGLVIGSMLREAGWSHIQALRAIHRGGHIRDDAQSEFVKNHV